MKKIKNEWLQRIAERLDKASQTLDEWYYEGSVEESKKLLEENPYIAIDYLLDNLEVLLNNDAEKKASEEDKARIEKLESRVAELERMNARLTKGMDILMTRVHEHDMASDIRLKVSEFIDVYWAMHSFDFENKESVDLMENHVYGHDFTVHWHGFYCNCSDGAVAANYILGGVEQMYEDEEVDWEDD